MSQPNPPYTKMARYYDAIYSKLVDYEAQTDYLEKVFAKHREVKSILDVASGTGNYAFVLAKRGYKVTGIDVSGDMIRVAKRKAGSKTNPAFLKMDMRDISLSGKYDAVTVLFGGFGYLLQRGDVEKFLQSAKSRLNRSGLLIFEFWQNSAMNPAASRRSGHSSADMVQDGNKLIIRLHLSRFEPHTNIQMVKFDHYVLDLRSKKLLDTFSEVHDLQTYSIPHIKDLLERNGFRSVAFYDGDIGNTKAELMDASPSTFRVLAVAKSRS